jgi:hypothetical protein
MQVNYITNASGEIESAVIPIHLWEQLQEFLRVHNFSEIRETGLGVRHIEETDESVVSFFRNSPLFGVELDFTRDKSAVRAPIEL